MRGPASRRPLLLLAFTVVLLAGCGGDRLSKHDYEQKLQLEYGQVQQSFQATAASFGQSDLADRIEHAQAQLRDSAEALEHVEPPKEIEEENEEIVEGLREYAEDLGALLAAARQNDQTAIAAFNERITRNSAIERIAEAAEEMKGKGYDVGPIGEE